jgi:hypothetical protein
MVIFAKCRLNINPSRSRGQKKGGTYPLSKKQNNKQIPKFIIKIVIQLETK